jgi:hypothetical protein
VLNGVARPSPGISVKLLIYKAKYKIWPAETGLFCVAYVAEIPEHFQWLQITAGGSMRHTFDTRRCLLRLQPTARQQNPICGRRSEDLTFNTI